MVDLSFVGLVLNAFMSLDTKTPEYEALYRRSVCVTMMKCHHVSPMEKTLCFSNKERSQTTETQLSLSLLDSSFPWHLIF